MRNAREVGIRGRRSGAAVGLALAWLVSLVVAAPRDAQGGKDAPAPLPSERQVKEARTEVAVRMALIEKLGADGMRVGIEVRGDEVTLAGRVKERSSQELVEEVALGVSGVRDVRNHVELVKPEKSDTPVASFVGKAEREVSDGLLETKVKLGLLDELGGNAFRVEVEATAGVVSLRGSIPSEEHRRLALASARGTSGVGRVIDLLKVN